MNDNTYILRSLLEDIKQYEIERRKDCSNYLSYIGQFVLPVLACEGLWATIIFRLGCIFNKLKLPIIAFILSKISRILTGNYIHYKSTIGPGLKISHSNNVIIAKSIGSNVHITTNVTVGQPFKRTGFDVRIGDNVYIGAGARIFASIGNNVGALRFG